MIGDARVAGNAAEQLGAMARAAGEQGPAGIADRMLSQARHYMGDHARARVLAERTLNHPMAVFHAGFTTAFSGIDRRISMRAFLARIDWMEGNVDRAVTLYQEAIHYSQDPVGFRTFALSVVLAFTAVPIAMWRGDLDEANALADRFDRAFQFYATAYWGEWGRDYKALIAARAAGTPAACRRELAKVRPGNALQIDAYATVMEEMVGPTALARVEAGGGGWCAAEVLRVSGERLRGWAPTGSCRGGRDDPARDRYCPSPERALLGVARHDEPRASAHAAGPSAGRTGGTRPRP